MGKPRRYRIQRRELARRQQQAAAAAGAIPAGQVQPQPGSVSFRGQLRHYTGPLPPPEILDQYNAVVPGAAERILKNFETESDHRRSLEREESEAGRSFMERQLNLLGRGQIFGLVVVIVGFATAGYAFRLGHQWGGSIIGSVDLVALVALFITGKRARTPPPALPPAQAGNNGES